MKFIYNSYTYSSHCQHNLTGKKPPHMRIPFPSRFRASNINSKIKSEKAVQQTISLFYVKSSPIKGIHKALLSLSALCWDS